MKEPTTPCRLCSEPTTMLGTKLCDRCWELETRINRDPDLAEAILTELRREKYTSEVENDSKRAD